jgi:hypothetical protein
MDWAIYFTVPQPADSLWGPFSSNQLNNEFYVLVTGAPDQTLYSNLLEECVK